MSKTQQSRVIDGYARMWPRTVFDIFENNRFTKSVVDLISGPGVYVLYRDDQPYYVGQSVRIFPRIWAHANQPKDRYYNFWNFFSVFTVCNRKYLDEIEGLLIASMPTENSAIHRIRKIDFPNDIARLIRAQRQIRIGKHGET